MLKIKDNVDLSILEKFGFEKELEHYSKIICTERRGQFFELVIGKDKILYGWSAGADGSGVLACIDNTLFDLIEAGLVEKVGE